MQQELLKQLRRLLHERFGIDHVTLQLETPEVYNQICQRSWPAACGLAWVPTAAHLPTRKPRVRETHAFWPQKD